MSVAWETIGEGNQYLHVAETTAFMTVTADQGRVYVQTGSTYQIATIPPAIYDGTTLAAALQGALGAGWSVSYIAVANQMGNLQVTGPGEWKFLSRREVISGAFPGANPAAMQDSCDLLGIVDSPATGLLTLAPAKIYRRIAVPRGFYTASTLADALQTALLAGSQMTTWSVTYSDVSGRLTIDNPDPNTDLSWEIWPESYLFANPYLWPGVAEPDGCDGVTGFEADSPLSGPVVVAPLHVNVLRYHTIFISSSLGTHGDTYGPLGQSTFARKVTVSEARGGIINDFQSLPHDYISLQPQSIGAITFRLVDWRGRTVPMSVPWSLSVILVPEEEF